MSNAQESLGDLIETRSAQHCLARWKLWEWAFSAIWDGALILEFPDGVASRDVAMVHDLIKGALPAIRDGANPSKWWWCRRLMISATVFDKWLAGAKLKHQLPAHLMRRAGGKPILRDAALAHVAKHYPNGVPPGVTYQQIANNVKAETGCHVSERTVRRALGRK
jgi:hypothetical protein